MNIFQSVLAPDHLVQEDTNDDPLDPIVEDDDDYIGIINDPITMEEVVQAIQCLKNGKAPGPDGIGEMFKNASDIVSDFFFS